MSVYPFEKYSLRRILVKFLNTNCKRKRLALYKQRSGKQQRPMKGMRAAYQNLHALKRT